MKKWIIIFASLCFMFAGCTSTHIRTASYENMAQQIKTGDKLLLNFNNGSSKQVVVSDNTPLNLIDKNGNHYPWEDISTVEVKTFSPGKSLAAGIISTVVIYAATVIAFNHELSDSLKDD